MPRVLFIVPDAYPPAPAVGCLRVEKFLKFLPEFGFSSVILTTSAHGRLASDAENGVHRSFDPEPWGVALARLGRSRRMPSSSEAAMRLVDSGGSTRLGRLKRRVVELLAVPDLRLGWLPTATIVGLRVIRRTGVDVLVSDSPSETAHLVGYCLARVTGKPWVADFRDGWLFESLKAPVRRDGWRRRVEGRLERAVVGAADAVITVSDPITTYFRDAYHLHPDRVRTIANGFDPQDWDRVMPRSRDRSKFLVVYTGSFGGSRGSQDPRPFLEALRLLPAETRQRTQVLLVGYLAPEERRECDRLGLGDLVTAIGTVSRPESLASQLSADALLLLVGRDASVATSKLYEYLFAGRPILVVSRPDSAAASIVLETGAGCVVSPTDPEAVARGLQAMFLAWREGRLGVKPRGIDRYDRRRLTGELAALLRLVIRDRMQGWQAGG